MSMRGIPDHPDIAHALRTGYPPWIKDEIEDDDIHALDCFGEEDYDDEED